MKATLLQPICIATDLGLTPSSNRMQVAVCLVAACQLVSGRPARLSNGLKLRRMKFEACSGLPTLLMNTSASPSTLWPSSRILFRWRLSASVALLVSPTLLRLPLVLGVSKVWPPYPLTRERCTCITRRSRSRSLQYRPVNSPQRAPLVSPNTYNASYLSPSAATRIRLASSRLNGLISGCWTLGGVTSVQTLCSISRHRTAVFKADDSTL